MFHSHSGRPTSTRLLTLAIMLIIVGRATNGFQPDVTMSRPDKQSRNEELAVSIDLKLILECCCQLIVHLGDKLAQHLAQLVPDRDDLQVVVNFLRIHSVLRLESLLQTQNSNGAPRLVHREIDSQVRRTSSEAFVIESLLSGAREIS